MLWWCWEKEDEEKEEDEDAEEEEVAEEEVAEEKEEEEEEWCWRWWKSCRLSATSSLVNCWLKSPLTTCLLLTNRYKLFQPEFEQVLRVDYIQGTIILLAWMQHIRTSIGKKLNNKKHKRTIARKWEWRGLMK